MPAIQVRKVIQSAALLGPAVALAVLFTQNQMSTGLAVGCMTWALAFKSLGECADSESTLRIGSFFTIYSLLFNTCLRILSGSNSTIYGPSPGPETLSFSQRNRFVLNTDILALFFVALG